MKPLENRFKVMDSEVKIAGMINKKTKNSGFRTYKSGPNQLGQAPS